MSVTASQVFDFLDQHPACVIEKHELHSVVFGTLRRGIRKIVRRLSENDEPDSEELANNLRVLLSEWLTVPICFDGGVLESLSSLGEASSIEMRWGRDIRVAYDIARTAALAIQQSENPARTQIRDLVNRLRTEGKNWRIYCHRRARPHFESIFEDEPLPSESFLHSVTDYREVRPFDTLIKMGPLRSRGWGSAPDAIMSAPRFETLAQIVWAGCADEEDFGYDPLAPPSGDTGPGTSKTGDHEISRARVPWTRTVIHHGNSSETSDGEPDIDELALFRELSRASEMRHATLVQIDEEDGILFPPHSRVPTFDSAQDAEDAIAYRLAGETLSEGMFIIWPVLGAADLGGLHAGEGHYSRVWKERLREKFRYTPNDLLQRLRDAGIDLRNLRSCVRQWCKPPSTVIHAPQQRRHFEILIKVLGIEHDSGAASSRALRRPWWEYAWSEIGHTRGEAIQSGMQEHEIVDEQLFVILQDLLPELRHNAQTQDFFQIEIPADKSLQGIVRFYKVRSIEEGFLVPDTILKIICDLDTVEQWRV